MQAQLFGGAPPVDKAWQGDQLPFHPAVDPARQLIAAARDVARIELRAQRGADGLLVGAEVVEPVDQRGLLPLVELVEVLDVATRGSLGKRVSTFLMYAYGSCPLSLDDARQRGVGACVRVQRFGREPP